MRGKILTLLLALVISGILGSLVPISSFNLEALGQPLLSKNSQQDIFPVLHDLHPDWPWPWWVQKQFAHPGGYGYSRDRGNNLWEFWGMIGAANRAEESLIGHCGELQPRAGSYALTFMVYDWTDSTLHCPQRKMEWVSQNLLYGYLPIVETRFDMGELGITLTEFSHQVSGIDLNFVQIEVANHSESIKDFSLFLVITPVAPQGVSYIWSMKKDPSGRFLWVNDQVSLICDELPQGYGFYGNPDSISSTIPYEEENPYLDAQDGIITENNSTFDSLYGYCRGVIQYNIGFPPGVARLTFKLPVAEISQVDSTLLNASYEMAFSEEVGFWEDYLAQGLKLQIPGSKRVEDTFKASLAYLYILMDDNEIHPGPTDYDFWWYRDGSVEATALSVAGQMDLAETFLTTVFPSRYDPATGRFDEPHGDEWDSNGQALWAFVNYYRLTRDSEFLEQMWPYIAGGAQWIEDKRSTQSDGLLPPGPSAEHLGSYDKKHYWDDFWGLAGLKSACFAAHELGYSQPESTFQSYYEGFWQDLFNSIHQIQQNQGIDYIANGPDLWDLNSFLIGSIAGTWPCGVLAPKDPDQTATLSALWDNCFINGGFLHEMAWSAYGPYLGTEVAHCYLLAGEREKTNQILNWQLDHSTQLNAWNEQVVPEPALEINWWYLGDIPHGWACAEYILLIRDCFFYEDFDSTRIVISPGVDQLWLPQGETISITDAPTYFGSLFSYSLTNNLDQRRAELILNPSEGPVGGYIFKSPFEGYRITGVEVDGEPIETFSPDEARLPAGSREVILSLEPTGVDDPGRLFSHPPEFKLDQNYPNPFNQLSVISYQLSVSAPTTLRIYNISGQLVKTLVNGRQGPGYHSVKWKGDDSQGQKVTSGIYFYRLQSGGNSQTRKLMLLK